MPNMLEKGVEENLLVYAEKRGFLVVKLNPLGFVGIPDRMILGAKGFVMFCELKRPVGGVLSPMQLWWQAKLRSFDFTVVCARTSEEAIGMFKQSVRDFYE